MQQKLQMRHGLQPLRRCAEGDTESVYVFTLHMQDPRQLMSRVRRQCGGPHADQCFG